jgi:hypothetical protein
MPCAPGDAGPAVFTGVRELSRMFVMVPIVFRHLSPAAFCKRNVLTVNLTVNGHDELR